MTDVAPPSSIDDPAALRERIATGQQLLMCDFDGTLAEIVERPTDAEPRDDARQALAELVDAPDTLVAVVSGRGLADLRERVALDDVAYAGNHGLEIDAGDQQRVHPAAEDARDELVAACEAIESDLSDVDGLRIEDKRLTATVHYRSVDDPAAVERVEDVVEATVADRSALELTRAKQALEIRPAVDWDKGRAAEWLHETLTDGEATPFYVGDDDTDEDALRAISPEGVTVRVGDGETVAEWRVPDPAATAELLAWIADLRTQA